MKVAIMKLTSRFENMPIDIAKCSEISVIDGYQTVMQADHFETYSSPRALQRLRSLVRRRRAHSRIFTLSLHKLHRLILRKARACVCVCVCVRVFSKQGQCTFRSIAFTRERERVRCFQGYPCRRVKPAALSSMEVFFLLLHSVNMYLTDYRSV